MLPGRSVDLVVRRDLLASFAWLDLINWDEGS